MSDGLGIGWARVESLDEDEVAKISVGPPV